MCRARANALRPWLDAARRTELRAFVAGIVRDRDAVLAALCFRWSTGSVEGHVKRLKVMKRNMYGRGKFDLLRKRVLSSLRWARSRRSAKPKHRGFGPSPPVRTQPARRQCGSGAHRSSRAIRHVNRQHYVSLSRRCTRSDSPTASFSIGRDGTAGKKTQLARCEGPPRRHERTVDCERLLSRWRQVPRRWIRGRDCRAAALTACCGS